MKRTIATPPGEESKSKKGTADEARNLKQDRARWKEKQEHYIRKRKDAYPPVEDQLDMIFHKGVTEWKKHIAKIKAKHPKE